MTNLKEQWDAYCEGELKLLHPLLKKHGFSLCEKQPHIQGERYLQQAITTTSGRKLILYGKGEDERKVVIKATRDLAGQTELRHERKCRQVLAKINFAGEVFHTPPEIAWISENGFLISIQAFIPQERTFLERPIEEQFSLALTAFKAQESAHATTYRHRRLIRGIYEFRDATTYLHNFSDFQKNIKKLLPDHRQLHDLIVTARSVLKDHAYTIEQYGGFLTHTDFVPHNLRIKDNTIYLLDHSSLTFGNKYEGWARFLNFMTLYHPPLVTALIHYVRDNRSPEESEALHLMRLYRLGELIYYYAKTLPSSVGDLRTLNTARIDFWSTVLSHELRRETVPKLTIEQYQNKRDALRSEDEKERQRGLH